MTSRCRVLNRSVPLAGPGDAAAGRAPASAGAAAAASLLHWLIQVIEEAFGTIGQTQSERQMCSELRN